MTVRFPDCKPSGEDCLGDIPSHWAVRAAKHASRVIMGQSPPSDAYHDEPGERPFLQGNAEFGEHNPTPKWYCDAAPKVVETGTLLLSVRAPVGALNCADQDYAIGRGLCGLAPDREHLDSRFAWWVLHVTRQALEPLSVGSTYDAVSAADVGRMPIPIPPLPEQRAIADYLDTETARIDTLISKKRRLIELLQERWRSEVMNTIFQQSHSVRRASIRHVVDLLPGYAFTSSEFAEEGIRLLRGLNIAPGRLRWDSDVVYVAAEDRPQYSEYELAEGDIVLGMDRPVIASGMRVASVSPSDLPCLLVQRVARIRTTEHADIRYIRFILESDAFVAYFSPISTGVSVPHISADQVLSFRAPLPSRGVQSALATQLATKQANLAALRDRLITQINLLSERRQALITAAVTGEVMVGSR